MNRKSLTQLLIILFSGFIFLGCESKEDNKVISISMNTWPGYEPIVLAKENGYLEDNVNINRMDSATDVLATFHSGITDIALVTLDEVLTLLDRVDYGVKIIAILDVSHGGDVILSQKNIKKLKDLKGKKIGVESTAIGAYLLLRAFELDPEISLNDVEIVPMLYSQHEEAFIKNSVSAVATFEPVKTALIKQEANILFDSTKIPGEIIDVMIVKDTTIKSKEKEIKKVLEAWFSSIDYLNSNKDKAMYVMAGFEGISPEEFKVAHRGLIVPTLDENKKYLSSKSGEVVNNIDRLQKLLIMNKMKNKEQNPKDIFTDILLPK